MNIHKLNKAFENRIRLGIMSVLMVNDSISFNDLKEQLKVTDGNLASHISSLEKLGYLSVIKRFINRKPNTIYTITKIGQAAFKAHITALENIINRTA